MDNIQVHSCHCEHCTVTLAEDLRERDARAEVHEESVRKGILHRRFSLMKIIVGVLLMTAGFFVPDRFATAFFIAAYLLTGYGVIINSFKSMFSGRFLDENFLMMIASAGAMIIGEHPEAAGVMLFYSLGEHLQDLAVDRSRRSIRSLLAIKPDYANIPVDGGLERVHPEEVEPGMMIVVQPGERIPLDGVIVSGESMIDTSAVTGESIPRDVSAGEDVYSGSVNLRGVLRIRVSKSFGESTASRILTLVSEASEHKSGTENFITAFARVYTPAVVAAAAVIAVVPSIFLYGAVTREWIYRGLIFLVVSCPCALVLSIPLAYFAGLGAASKKGILIKGGNVLDALVRVRHILFDKTGTLTHGAFSIIDVSPAGGETKEDLLFYTACGEYHSNHPIADSIRRSNIRPVDPSRIGSHEDLSGFGVRTHWEGREILVGNRRLMEREGIPVNGTERMGVSVYVALDGKALGTITLGDTVKPGSRFLKRDLAALGIGDICILTGDTRDNAAGTAAELGIDHLHAGLLPAEKLTVLETYRTRPGLTMAVGDGINDAPLLAGADVGVAMGSLGSDAAVEVADMVLMNDNPALIAEGLRIAKKTRRIVGQNIAIALGVKALVMALSAFGLAAMYQAIIADVGVALAAVLNSVRIIRK